MLQQFAIYIGRLFNILPVVNKSVASGYEKLNTPDCSKIMTTIKVVASISLLCKDEQS